MSLRKERFMSLAATIQQDRNLEDLRKLARETLNSGIHGLCFSPYESGQKPGDIISEDQIRRRMEIIRPYTNWVRSFSCTDGNELIPKVAHDLGMKTLVGAWLGTDPEINKREIEGLIQVARQGYVDIAAVGNEVLYRGDLTKEELLAFIHQVKRAIPEVPVGYVDAYYEFSDHPEVSAACDIILANCYPFWEGCNIDYSLMYMKEMYHIALEAGKGKKVIITETGWPSHGSDLHGAHPSEKNYLNYFINSQRWSRDEDIPMFYFSSFDESWKVGAEGDVGACWGLWDEYEKLKLGEEN